MSKNEVRERIRALFSTKRGADLVDAIADEIGALHAATTRLSEQLRNMQLFQEFSERVTLLEEVLSTPRTLPSAVTISASYLLPSTSGLYDIEYEANGRAFRWSGPRQEFGFAVYMDRSAELRLRIEVASMVDPDIQRELLLLVDGHTLPLLLIAQDDGYVGEAILPANTGQRATNLVVVVPVVLPAADGGNSRLLGVAFRELSISPAIQVSVATSGRSMSHMKSFGRDHLGPIPAGDRGGTTVGANRTYDSVLGTPASHRPARPEFARIDAHQLEDDDQMWYSLEYDQERRPFRWTGPKKTFSVTLSANRAIAQRLTLRLFGVVDRSKQVPIIVEVDGSNYELDLVNLSDGTLCAGVVIPPSTRAEPTTIFRFTVAAVLKPKGADRRLLGVAFHSVELESLPLSQAEVRISDSSAIAEPGGDLAPKTSASDHCDSVTSAS